MSTVSEISKINRGETGSLASKFRKGTYPRKPDFWFLMKAAGTIQEILYEETSGTPFASKPDKNSSDLYKLFRFGRDSKNMMTDQLITKNFKQLKDYEDLWKQLCEIEVFLFHIYGIFYYALFFYLLFFD